MAKLRPKQIILRPMAEADFTVLPTLTAGPGEASRVFWELDDPTDAAAVRALLKDHQDLTVAELGGRVVGFGALYQVEEGRQGHLGPVLVDPQFRGHGVGSRLMSHLLDRAFRYHRLREVRASVSGENGDGVMLLSETGFVPYCNEERTGPDGCSRVVVQMRIDRRAWEGDD